MPIIRFQSLTDVFPPVGAPPVVPDDQPRAKLQPSQALRRKLDEDVLAPTTAAAVMTVYGWESETRPVTRRAVRAPSDDGLTFTPFVGATYPAWEPEARSAAKRLLRPPSEDGSAFQVSAPAAYIPTAGWDAESTRTVPKVPRFREEDRILFAPPSPPPMPPTGWDAEPSRIVAKAPRSREEDRLLFAPPAPPTPQSGWDAESSRSVVKLSRFREEDRILFVPAPPIQPTAGVATIVVAVIPPSVTLGPVVVSPGVAIVGVSVIPPVPPGTPTQTIEIWVLNR